MDAATPEQCLPHVLQLPAPSSPRLASSSHMNNRQCSPASPLSDIGIPVLPRRQEDFGEHHHTTQGAEEEGVDYAVLTGRRAPNLTRTNHGEEV